MNSNQAQSQVGQTGIITSLAPARGVRKFIRNNLLGTITLTIAGSVLLAGTSAWNIWTIYNGFQSTVTRQFELERISGTLIHDDEFFTSTTWLLAYSGDLKWEKRYQDYLPTSLETQRQLLAKVTPELAAEAKKTDASANKLFELEKQAFNLVKQGKQQAAFAIIAGKEYSTQKQLFSDGNKQVLAKVEQSIQAELHNYQQKLLISMIFAGVTLPLLLGSWILVWAAVRDYIRDRQASLIAIEQGQKNLISLDEVRYRESELYQQQEKTLQEARDILERDIDELLAVVSRIESGDFTVHAQMNDRPTGLVSHVLNRMVDGLGLVFSQVSLGTQQVAFNSNQQDELAADVARNTSAQAKSVDRVLALTETVRQSANSAATQLAENNRSLVSLQSAVTAGEITIESLDREIAVLQQGSDRIVQQMKALGEFIGLADRFVYDQTDIATQTQILALNASLVAARAAEQRDPRQFEAVAREFESIADQVSQLAQQTNEGLTSLEQSNTQINKVVSDVDGEVQRLGGLVDSFTQGIKQTRDVFANVQSVTGSVVQTGEAVSQTSQTIVESADSTAKSIAAIATLSAQIDAQSQIARSISSEMNDLSTKLLDNIQIFRLPNPTTLNLLPQATELSDAESEPKPIAAASKYQLS
jgi:methyl-accepting chemotaxis protein PixJ